MPGIICVSEGERHSLVLALATMTHPTLLPATVPMTAVHGVIQVLRHPTTQDRLHAIRAEAAAVINILKIA